MKIFQGDNFDALWAAIEAKFDKRVLRQFRKAHAKPRNVFAERIVRPRLYLPNEVLGDTYYPVDVTALSERRNHYTAKTIVDEKDPQRNFGGDPWTALSYFANPLWIRSDQPLSEQLPPKDRVVLGEHQVLTYEFDVPDPAFFKHQLAWLRSSNGQLDCPMGNFYRHCSKHADFEGLTVCWSGNKSLHIHAVFATELARINHRLGNSTTANLRHGLISHWERLHDDLIQILDTKGHHADKHLRFPESFRRVPNGSRVIDDPKNLLGLPLLTSVPQWTLWEKYRDRAAGDVLFFTPEPFAESEVKARAKRANTAVASLGGCLSPAEVTFCEEKLRAIYSKWPRFDHLAYRSGWVAHFRNSEQDQNPASIMHENCDRILLAGRDVDGLEPIKLHRKLGEMMHHWCEQLAFSDEDVDQARSIREHHQAAPSECPIEKDFAETVTDVDSARRKMQEVFLKAIPSEPHLIVCGPEGVGKTSSLFQLHGQLIDVLRRQGDSTLAMYAFADYDTVIKKCAAFNIEQEQNGFVGVVIPSFDRAYTEACRSLGIPEKKKITIQSAAKKGFASLTAAIKSQQPKVWDYFRDEHRKLWARIGAHEPAFFCVHQVMHDWNKNSPARLMWAKSYYDEREDRAKHRNKCRTQTTLGLAIHDEIKTSSLIVAEPTSYLRWIKELFLTDRNLWRGDAADLSKRYASYKKFEQENGLPVIHGRTEEVKFEDAVRIIDGGFDNFEEVTTRDTGEYGARALVADSGQINIYGPCHGRQWSINSRDWWDGIAKRLVLLTTEELPVAVARRADPSFKILTLRTPLIRPDCVEVIKSRFVTSDNLEAACAKFLDQHPTEEFHVVSNKVTGMPNARSHMAARGSNDLIGKNVLETMSYMAPREYEGIQALNAWTTRTDLVGLRHIDEFNQTAGRNMGFRKQGDVRHVVLINLSLYDVLVSNHATGHSRYTMQVMVDRNQRYEMLHRKNGGAGLAA